MSSMQEKMIREAMAVMNGHAASDVAVNLYPFIRKYTDGRVERLLTSTYVTASEDARGGVATRDVVIDSGNGVSARLFLPAAATTGGGGGKRLPVVLYFHGGSFCTESAFCRTYHRYVSSLASRAGALVLSVEYRLAPEHPIPAAYDDAWAALRWVESLSDPWLAEYGDRSRTFLAGDSAGGNIAYHTVARASRENGDDGRIQGLIMVHPFFWGTERLPCEAVWDGASVFPAFGVDWLWPFVTAGQADNDDPRIDPTDEELASLSCRRVLMAVAGRDTLRDRGRRLASRMRGHVMLVESEGEDHGFHLYSPLRATSKKLMKSIVQFINQPSPPAPVQAQPLRWPATVLSELDDWSTYDDNSSQILLGMPSRSYKAIFVDRLNKKLDTGSCSNTVDNASLTIRRRGKASKTTYGISSLTRATCKYRGIAAAGSQCQHPFRGVLW